MTLEQIVENKNKYKGLIIDTNLLLLFLVGSYDENQILSFNRLKKFSKEDFYLIDKFVTLFSDKILITPHIITEICNLSDSLNKNKNYGFFKFLETQIEKYKEENLFSITLIKNDNAAFYKFGLADSGIIDLAKQNSLVVTDDLALYHMIIERGFDALNFTRLMDLY